MKKTYNNVITALETFAANHKQLNSVLHGDLWQMSTSDIVYPHMQLTPSISNINGREMELNIQIGILDILQEDNSNLKDVLSDTLQIMNDVITEFFDNEAEYGFVASESGVSLEPFVQAFDDNVGGFFAEVKFIIENRLNKCEIPN